MKEGFLDGGVGDTGSDGESVFWRRWSSLRAERGAHSSAMPSLVSAGHVRSVDGWV
jgi:hypothetical protein